MEKSRKWFSIKVNMDGYVLLRKLAALLGLRQYKVVFVSLLLLDLLLLGETEKAKQVLALLHNRLESRKWLVDRMIETLNEVLER